MDQRLLLAIADTDVAGTAAALASEGEGLTVVATVTEPDEVARALRRAAVDVVVLHDTLGDRPVLTLAREIASGFPEVGLVLIAADDSPAMMRSAMQAGLRDVLTLPLTFDELEAGVRAAAQWSRTLRERVTVDESAASSGLGGQLIAVTGAKGGVGTTTVALNLALAATRAAPGRPICLADFDLLTGDMRTLLDTPPRRSVADLVEVASELTVRHLQETLYSHPAGVRLLLAPEEGERGEDVTSEVTRNILDAVRSRHALTIVDVGATPTEASVAAMEAATRLVIVATPDILALRGVHRTRELLRRLQVREDDAVVVLNRTSRKLEVQPEVARRVVGAQFTDTTIPADFPAFEPLVNTGQPNRLTDQKLLNAFDKLAAELDAVPGEEEDGELAVEESRGGGGGLLSRLTGERGQSTVEFMGILPLIILLAVAVWQIGLLGFTYVLAGNAAREGARELATDTSDKPKSNPPYAKQAKAVLPPAWRDGADVKRVSGESKVKVKLQVPLLVPGLISVGGISTTAGNVIEDEDLDDDYKKPSGLPKL